MGEWQDISTAQSGEVVLAYEPSQGVCVCWYDRHVGWLLVGPWNGQGVDERDLLMYRPPTHWQPLPEPPTASPDTASVVSEDQREELGR